MEAFVNLKQKDSSFRLEAWMDKFDGLSVGFTSRLGGVSQHPMKSLNCALHVGDRIEDVIANRQLVAEGAGFTFDAWTCAEQVHGNAIKKVTLRDKGAGKHTRDQAIQDTDALISNESGVMLAAFFADCVPLYFIDPVHHAIGLAHAGWKGTALHIAERTIEAMQREFGSQPEHLLTAIGPSIGVCCYEVNDQVIEQLDCEPPAKQENGRYMLDLKETNRQFMIRAGILPINIEISEWCTSCNTDLFYSHRAENGQTGRMTAWIGWKDEVT
ncbi:MAG: peptidoglycan editing factor PgeF [Paenibacillaceae bacterium]